MFEKTATLVVGGYTSMYPSTNRNRVVGTRRMSCHLGKICREIPQWLKIFHSCLENLALFLFHSSFKREFWSGI